MSNTLRRYAIAAVVCLASATAVQAQGLPDVPTGTVLSEVMMDAQGSEAMLYGSLLGSSMSTQMLSGTSSTDISAGSFSFSLNAGSTYLGQSISDSVQGQYNAMDGSYDWTSTGSSGLGVQWMANGVLMPVENNPMGPQWQILSYEQVYTLLSFPPKYIYQGLDTITIIGGANGKPAISIKNSNVKNPGGGAMGGSIGTDTYDPVTGMYRFRDLFTPVPLSGLQPLSFQEDTSGITPFAGGSGTYTTSISSVPEPSSLLMALIGMGTVLGVVAWRPGRGVHGTACSSART
jgi:PEP-CTERM motif